MPLVDANSSESSKWTDLGIAMYQGARTTVLVPKKLLLFTLGVPNSMVVTLGVLPFHQEMVLYRL